MPAFSFQNVNLSHVGLTIAIGFAFVIYIAWQQRQASWKISTFFVGGRNIGAPLTAQTYWGSSFAFANGIIYFAVFGNLFGLSVIWFQIPWIIGIWILAWRLPQLMKITDSYTLHGFLGSIYGPWARIAASLVTIIGFMGFFAYEIVISIEVVSGILGIKSGITFLTLVVAIYVAVHADVGGYLGMARTDRIQNMLGMIAVILVIYYLVAFPDNFTNKTNLSIQNMADSLFSPTNIPWKFWSGILCFAFFINIVDISHWQSIAANSNASEDDTFALRRAIVKSSLWMMVFPASAGAFIGYVWRGVDGITDNNLLPASVAGLPGASNDVSGFVAGFVILGLLAVGFSSAAGYLLSSIQTAIWDLRHHGRIFGGSGQDFDEDEEQSIVFEARAILYAFAIASVVLFMAARAFVGDDNILPLQFVLVAVVVSLFPATALGLWLHHRGRTPAKSTSRWIIISIIVGFFAGLLVYFRPILLGGDLNSVFQWAPVISLGVSSAIAFPFVLREVFNRTSVNKENGTVVAPTQAEETHE